MKHVATVRGDYYTDLETKVEEKLQELQSAGIAICRNCNLQELQSAGNEIVNVSLGGRGNESTQDWVAIILYE